MTTKAPAQFQWKNTWNQYFAVIAANILQFSQGNTNGWPSPALPVLSSEKSPLVTGPLTIEELSWIGSINCIGGIFGSLLYGYVIPIVGSKRALVLLTIPSVAFWVMIYFGFNFYHIFIARFVAGAAGGSMQSAVMLYVAEIANNDIRGRLGSIWLFMRNSGVLFVYVAGTMVDYEYLPYVCVVPPILFGLVFMMVPDTPQYLLQKGQIQNAEKSLKYYKGYKGSSKEEEMAFYKEFERLKLIATEQKTEEKLQLSDFLNRSALKGLGIGIALTAFSMMTANFLLIGYAVLVFERSGASLDPYVSSIMLAIALICGSLLTTSLADKLGRKTLNVISLLGSAVGHFAMAAYYYLHLNGYNLESFVWVPVASLSFVIFISAAGIVPLSFVCSIEFLPSKVRNIGMAIIVVTISITAFITIKLFPPFLEIIDLHGCMTFFAIGSLLGAIYVILVVDETSGKCLDDVGADEREKVEYIARSRVNSIY